MTPVKAESASGSKLKIEKDHSVLASGKKADTDTYTVSFTNGVTEVVGLRLEALPHDSLPAKGPGRAENGNFVLTEVDGENPAARSNDQCDLLHSPRGRISSRSATAKQIFTRLMARPR